MKSRSVSSFSLIPCRPPFRFQFSVFNFQLPSHSHSTTIVPVRMKRVCPTGLHRMT